MKDTLSKGLVTLVGEDLGSLYFAYEEGDEFDEVVGEGGEEGRQELR